MSILSRVANQPKIVASIWWTNLFLLFAGLLLPVMKIEKLVFWEDSYSIVVGTYNLFTNGKVFMGLIILLFSICFPIVKLAAVGWVWFVPNADIPQEKVLHWVALLGKWSMLDVFVVAVIVVLSGSKALGETSPGPGLYVFAVAIFLSMGLTEVISRTLRQRQTKA